MYSSLMGVIGNDRLLLEGGQPLPLLRPRSSRLLCLPFLLVVLKRGFPSSSCDFYLAFSDQMNSGARASYET